ncbi:MAG: vitamin B12 dependent methionine synthase [Eggerthellaceae bacterium]|nr:vitamin B12 dependent methionine synthase [Eggerthellaceae bacterium]
MRLSASVDADEALRYLGYRGQKIDGDLRARLEDIASLCEKSLSPKGLYRICEIENPDEEDPDVPVLIRGCNLALPGRAIKKFLKGADKVALMASTLGLESERLIRKSAAASKTDGLLTDAAASSMAESAMQSLHEIVREEASAEGMAVGKRFSPGYGDLPLDVQRPFLGALDATRRIGLTLTDNNLLVPVKSVTAIAAIYDDAILR